MAVESGELDVDGHTSFEERRAYDYPGFIQGKNTAAEKNHLTTKHGLRTPEGFLVSAKLRRSYDQVSKTSFVHSLDRSQRATLSQSLHIFFTDSL